MFRFGRNAKSAGDSAQVAVQGVSAMEGGKWAAVLSLIALGFSGYSLWETSLKAAEVQVFVPPVIQYAAPYQNSNFEVIAVPVTLSNEGARTATVLSMELAVTDPRTKATKLFYAADFGRWSMERTRTGAYEPFAPLSLAGRSSRTESVLFYTRGQEQQPNEIIRQPGEYQFKLTLDVAEDTQKPSVTFDRSLLNYDARAFNEGTLPLYSADWQSASNAKRD
jgi:hypothetical protein